LRSEFELDRPRGLAGLRALAASVGDLERERIRSHLAATQEPVSPMDVTGSRARVQSV